MNRVVLVGRITRDPELKTIPNGSVVNFTIAVNRTFVSKNGEREADFINCVVFNRQAENLSKYIKKGGLLGIEGRIQTRSYQASDGTNRYITEVVCDGVNFLEPRGNQAPSYQPTQGAPYQSNQGSSYQSGNSFQGQNQNTYDDLQYENYHEENEKEDKKDSFDAVESHYGITDDDLPF